MNAEGYAARNCVAACKICNVMKSTYDQREFIAHCQRIARAHA